PGGEIEHPLARADREFTDQPVDRLRRVLRSPALVRIRTCREPLRGGLVNRHATSLGVTGAEPRSNRAGSRASAGAPRRRLGAPSRTHTAPAGAAGGPAPRSSA